jgi:molecular chaperone GrpE
MTNDDLNKAPINEEETAVKTPIEAEEATNVNEQPTEAEASASEEPVVEPTEAEASATEEPVVEPTEEVQQPSEAEVYRDRLIRLQADFDNYRKRMARDRADMIKSANADLLSAMLPALDHIDHALASLEKTTAGTEATESNPYIEGFKLIQNELLRGLDKFGLSPIESIGKPFDVEVHEALSKMPSDSIAPEHVLFEVRKGYMLNGKVLRAAQVIVSAPVE